MNKEEFASMLDGRQYLSEITEEEERIAFDNELVVVFGRSDDLMEFRGAINYEAEAWEGTTEYIDEDGLIHNECYEECPYFQEKVASASYVEAEWRDYDPNGAWHYKTDIPHAKFVIMEDDEPYGQGIVFQLSDVK